MLLDNVKQLIESIVGTKYQIEYGVTTGTKCDSITITEYGGKPLGDFTHAASRYLQIRLKHSKASTGYNDIWKIYNTLVLSREHRTEDYWMQVKVPGVPLPLGQDKNNLQNYTLNVYIFTDIKEEI